MTVMMTRMRGEDPPWDAELSKSRDRILLTSSTTTSSSSRTDWLTSMVEPRSSSCFLLVRVNIPESHSNVFLCLVLALPLSCLLDFVLFWLTCMLSSFLIALFATPFIGACATSLLPSLDFASLSALSCAMFSVHIIILIAKMCLPVSLAPVSGGQRMGEQGPARPRERTEESERQPEAKQKRREKGKN